MDIFTAIIGEDIEKIQKAKNFTSKDEAEEYVESQKEEEQGGIINGEVDEPEDDEASHEQTSANKYDDKESWGVIDNSAIDGVLCKHKSKDNLWLIIKIYDQEIETQFLDMSDRQCSECESQLTPHTEDIAKCEDCGALFGNNNSIDKKELGQIMQAARSINIESEDGKEGVITEEAIEFDDKNKLPGFEENGTL